ncbi:MAG: response regulator [Candidatus Hydrogenedentes bacterium]|nr:response regulator [Candidatus Hydrogenedentota bacterium]
MDCDQSRGNASLCVLLFEDSNPVNQPIEPYLSGVANLDFAIEVASDHERGLSRLSEGGVDAVVLNQPLHDESQVDVLKRVHAHSPNVPIIVTAETGDHESIIAAVQYGAEDYFIKDEAGPDVLARTIRFAAQVSSLRLRSA